MHCNRKITLPCAFEIRAAVYIYVCYYIIILLRRVEYAQRGYTNAPCTSYKVRTNYYPPLYLYKYNMRVHVYVLVSCITL